MMELHNFIHRVEPPQIADLNDFVHTTDIPWDETPEAMLGFDEAVNEKLQELHDFSKTATKKQTRNQAKKLAKQITTDKTKAKFSMVPREVTIRFD